MNSIYLLVFIAIALAIIMYIVGTRLANAGLASRTWFGTSVAHVGAALGAPNSSARSTQGFPANPTAGCTASTLSSSALETFVGALLAGVVPAGRTLVVRIHLRLAPPALGEVVAQLHVLCGRTPGVEDGLED